jgi:hypothetical protein
MWHWRSGIESARLDHRLQKQPRENRIPDFSVARLN